MLDELGVAAMAEWEAFYELEPFGPSTDFWRAGLIAAMVLNVNRKPGTKPIAPHQLMPAVFTDGQTRRQTAQERVANFRQLMRGGRRG